VKITDIRTTRVEYPYKERPIISGAGVNANRRALLVHVKTDMGIEGLGEAGVAGGPASSTIPVIEQELAPLLIGQDPFDVERLWQLMYLRSRQHGRSGIVMHAISGIDIALWDIIAKSLNQPLYKILGACRDRIPAYGSGGFYQEGKTNRDLADECRGFIEEGYRAVKIKTGRNRINNPFASLEYAARNDFETLTLREELERIRVVRASCNWDYKTAITMAKAMEPLGVTMLEEPLSPDDIDGTAQLAAATSIAIGGYETETGGLWAFRKYIDARAVDIVQVDLGRAGGITEGRRIAAYAYAHQLPFTPHVYTSAVIFAASLHFMASIPNAWWFEHDRNENGLREALIEEPFTIDRDGNFRLPHGPGLGITLSESGLRQLTVR
jgi:L-alanine-DL-glutamate epimerase-like enolase superfamily enzyme